MSSQTIFWDIWYQLNKHYICATIVYIYLNILFWNFYENHKVLKAFSIHALSLRIWSISLFIFETNKAERLLLRFVRSTNNKILNRWFPARFLGTHSASKFYEHIWAYLSINLYAFLINWRVFRIKLWFRIARVYDVTIFGLQGK